MSDEADATPIDDFADLGEDTGGDVGDVGGDGIDDAFADLRLDADNTDEGIKPSAPAVDPEPVAEPVPVPVSEPATEPTTEPETVESIAAQIAALEAKRDALAAPAKPTEPEATPAPVAELEYEISEEDHDLVLGDPKAHATLLAAHGRHILGLAAEQARAMLPALIQKATFEESRSVYALVALEGEFPDADEAVLLTALNGAVAANPGARTPVVLKAAREALSKVIPQAKTIAARTVDARAPTSQFRSPTPSGRGTRAGAASPQRDPTEQALEEIGGLNLHN